MRHVGARPRELCSISKATLHRFTNAKLRPYVASATGDGLGEDGKPTKLPLSALFRKGTDTLLLYCYRFPRVKDDPRAAAESGEIAKLPKAEQPCPSCTGLLDQLNG